MCVRVQVKDCLIEKQLKELSYQLSGTFGRLKNKDLAEKETL